MKYSLVHVGPNKWFDYKADACFGIIGSLMELGYDVNFKNNEFATDRMNIVVGIDWLVTNGATNLLAENNVEYIAMEGELIHNKTLNNRDKFDFDLYLDYMHNAKAIITPFKHNLKEFYNLGLTAQYFRWGDYPGRVQAMPNMDVLYPLSYYGMLKGQRKETFNKIQAKLEDKVFAVSVNEPFKYKDLCVNFSNATLSLSAGDIEIVNPIRIIESLANGIPLFHNHKYDPDKYSANCDLLPDLNHVSFDTFDVSKEKRKELRDFATSFRLVDGLRELDI